MLQLDLGSITQYIPRVLCNREPFSLRKMAPLPRLTRTFFFSTTMYGSSNIPRSLSCRSPSCLGVVSSRRAFWTQQSQTFFALPGQVFATGRFTRSYQPIKEDDGCQGSCSLYIRVAACFLSDCSHIPSGLCAKKVMALGMCGWKSKASGNTIPIPVRHLEVLRTLAIFKVITVAVNLPPLLISICLEFFACFIE